MIIIIACQDSLDWLRNHGDDIVYLDASWRNKNENGAPMTNLIVAHKVTGRLLPGATLISSEATSAVFAKFLEERIRAVNNRANSTHWSPKSVMIDKDTAFKKAIRDAIPTAKILLCQFHVHQIFKRLLKDARLDGQQVKLTEDAKEKLYQNFCLLRRSASITEFREKIPIFKMNAGMLLMEENNTEAIA